MIIKPTTSIKRGKLHCCKCGNNVPFKKENLTQLCQTKIKNKNTYLVYIGYVCPKCVQVNNIVLYSSKSKSKIIKKINLYGEY